MNFNTNEFSPPTSTLWTTTDSGWYKSSLTYTITAKEGPVVKKAKSYLVIQRGSGTVAAVEETEGDALSAAARLATKTGEEYFVFRPGKVVRQKPVDIETIDS